ncbi:SWIM zinc finger family protein [Streptomyces odontomachi]|uniref:SWIM zinc finger family protein n=1 Tax=Streptomyces odontomachi TaxID=2944940 RepID=UPI00210AEFA5|nr:SWIM zinc finger family protein [Streptomyces sp. ODS25]
MPEPGPESPASHPEASEPGPESPAPRPTSADARAESPVPRPADEARRALRETRRALAERKAAARAERERMRRAEADRRRAGHGAADRPAPTAPARSEPASATWPEPASVPEEDPTSAPGQDPAVGPDASGPDASGPDAASLDESGPEPAPAAASEQNPATAPGNAPDPAPGHELPSSVPGDATASVTAAPVSFAITWWGRAWVAALEEGALDPARVVRGRAYAGRGQVGAISVTPGRLLAYVQGSRPRPYRAQVRLRTLSAEDWDRFLDAAAERPGHIAALLDKDLPHSLADCGVPLLPGPGDLVPQCSCPDSGWPCKHAAALCYEAARLLDDNPFVLLQLRGRGEHELIEMLSRRHAGKAARAAHASRAPAPFPGVPASDVFGPGGRPSAPTAPLPAPLPAPARPGAPPAYPMAPGGPDPLALDQLATDAAARAHTLLTTGRDPVGELTLWQDAVRLAAARPGSGLTAATRGLYATLADATGRTTAELARAVAAWRQGGAEGLAVLEEPWDPPAGRFDRARSVLLAADFPAFRPWRNHLTHPRGHLQLRFGRDGLWYGYESEPGRDDWWPRGVRDLDPVGALAGLDIDRAESDADRAEISRERPAAP